MGSLPKSIQPRWALLLHDAAGPERGSDDPVKAAVGIRTWRLMDCPFRVANLSRKVR